MLKRRVGKLHTSGELLEVELLFLRDEELPEDRPFADDCAWWSMLGMAGGWGGPRKEREPEGFLGPARPSVFDMWRAVGEGIVQDWIKDAPGTRPRCWWKFDAPEPRAAGETQVEYLRRHSLLLPGEARQLAH
jgi:hypothetical protein